MGKLRPGCGEGWRHEGCPRGVHSWAGWAAACWQRERAFKRGWKHRCSPRLPLLPRPARWGPQAAQRLDLYNHTTGPGEGSLQLVGFPEPKKLELRLPQPEGGLPLPCPAPASVPSVGKSLALGPKSQLRPPVVRRDWGHVWCPLASVPLTHKTQPQVPAGALVPGDFTGDTE